MGLDCTVHLYDDDDYRYVTVSFEYLLAKDLKLR